MKNFTRNNLLFSLCGLNCCLCPMNIGGYCPGCGGGDGNQSCAIARCSLEHERIEYCWLCSEYPCARFKDIDSSDSFITHRNQIKDMERARDIGISRYTEELMKKREILNILLSEFNDGRRKSFYCLATGLLPLHVLEKVMSGISSDPCLTGLADLKDKAKHVTSMLMDAAAASGIELKLRK